MVQANVELFQLEADFSWDVFVENWSPKESKFLQSFVRYQASDYDIYLGGWNSAQPRRDCETFQTSTVSKSVETASIIIAVVEML